MQTDVTEQSQQVDPQPPAQDWKRAWARDFLACGSWVFYLLIIGRALMRPYRPMIDQLAFGGLVLVLANRLTDRFDPYIARGVVLAVVVILFYENVFFTGFIIVASAGLVASARYLGSSWSRIGLGLAAGAVATVIGLGIGHFTQHIGFEGVAAPED